jgi:hypothetical protein
MKVSVVDDVGFIIKLPGSVKGVGVTGNDHQRKKKESR